MGFAIDNNFLPLTGGSRIQGVKFAPSQYTKGVVDTTQQAPINLENKTGTSNQTCQLWGKTTIAAQRLDFSA